MISPDPSAALSNRRPCPYCGGWNDADFTFCQRCGKSLPSLGDLEGDVAAGDTIRLLQRSEDMPTVTDVVESNDHEDDDG